MLSSCEACYWSAYDCHGMSIYDNNDNSGKRVDKEDGGGSRDSHVVPPPPPVPPSPLEPSAVQGVGSPTGRRAHRGGDLPLSSATDVATISNSEESNSPLPKSLLPLPGCKNPEYCVGGLPHVSFSAPGGLAPTREQIEWVTLRYMCIY